MVPNEGFTAEEEEEEMHRASIGVIFQLHGHTACDSDILCLKSQNPRNFSLHVVTISQLTHLFAPNNRVAVTCR